MTLEDLNASLHDCERCRLSAGRTQVVFGTGNPNATLMFVGEAPGYYEDRQGEPFVGAAGKLLTELLRGIGMSRADTYIANVIKCRPPNNRDPLPDEVETCRPFLLQQIQLIRPKLVCTLGNFATQTLLQKKVGITKVRGRPFQMAEFVVFPMFHPAAALHQASLQEPLRQDFQALKHVLGEMTARVSFGSLPDSGPTDSNPARSPLASSDVRESPNPSSFEQMDLFH